MSHVLCVDFGSTFTKAALVDTGDGALLATAAHPTTSGTDVLEGFERVHERVAAQRVDEVLACSSAGGGLRLAVVGYEAEVTAEAGRRVGLSAGARVVHVAAGPMTDVDVQALRDSVPDVVLLVGGTDGGNADVLLHNASRLAEARLVAPVVVAGNMVARDDAVRRLTAGGCSAVATANVLPRIGIVDAEPARATVREVFLRHVIGGKGLSRRPAFAGMVRSATPDAMLTGVCVLADGAADVAGVGDVLVVDVGGATTDVYSVLTPSGEDAELRKEVVEPLRRSRTVEGDLGMRSSAQGVVEAAVAERLVSDADADRLRDHVDGLPADPAFVPATNAGSAADTALARLAVTVALRRHGRPAGPASAPRLLADVRLVVGSGGLLRHSADAVRRDVLAAAVDDHAGGWRVPRRAALAVDARYVLFAAGLLAAEHPRAAARLATTGLHRLG